MSEARSVNVVRTQKIIPRLMYPSQTQTPMVLNIFSDLHRLVALHMMVRGWGGGTEWRVTIIYTVITNYFN